MSDVFAAVMPELTDFTESSMPDTFTVDVRGSFVPDGQGGGRYNPSVTPTRGPYRCRLSSGLNEEEQAVADRLEQRDAQRMTFPLAVQLAGEEKGSVSNARTGETFRFEVLAIVRPPSYAVHRKALIRRL